MGRETLARLERCQGRDLRGWALQPAPASASAPGLRLGKAECQAVVVQTLLWGGRFLSMAMALSGQLMLSRLWECAKHKPNRKLGFLRALKGEARICKEAPPSTSTLEHTDQSTKHRRPVSRPQVCGLQRRAAGKAGAGHLPNGSCLFFQIPPPAKYMTVISY